jgi:hypothetical protein
MSEHGMFMRVASAIGDLGSPFYEEERQRDVWNEASAVGFQAMLWSSLVAANVMIWVGRATALPYSLGLLAIMGGASILAVVYADRAGVQVEHALPVDGPSRLGRPALVLFALLFASYLAGLLTAVDWAAGGFTVGAAVGAMIGAVGALVVLAVRLLRRRA